MYIFSSIIGTCPSGISWVDKAYSIDRAHISSVCSGAGICDSTTGTCKCFPGFTGYACQRSNYYFILLFHIIILYYYYFVGMCPNDCSGRGTCLSLKDIGIFYGKDYDSTIISYGDGQGPAYSNWEKDSMYMCSCDYGFYGPDCSLGILYIILI